SHSDIRGRFLLRCTGLTCYTYPAMSGLGGSPMRRREFIRLLGGALAAQAIPANAQELRVPTVGVLMGFANDAEAKARVQAFEQGLESEGWSVGQNLRIEYRYAEGDFARMEALAKELVELKPGCILGQSTPVTAALMRATRTIPIVFVAVSDPIGSGFVASMVRPGGNITGFTVLRGSIAGKYLEILNEMVPQLARVALMYNPNSVPDGGTFFSVRSSSRRQNCRCSPSSRKYTMRPKSKMPSRNLAETLEAASFSCRIIS